MNKTIEEDEAKFEALANQRTIETSVQYNFLCRRHTNVGLQVVVERADECKVCIRYSYENLF